MAIADSRTNCGPDIQARTYKMLTPKQLAERLSLSLSMVYRLLANGELECYRFGAAYRVSEEQLNAFLQKQKVETHRKLPKARRHF